MHLLDDTAHISGESKTYSHAKKLCDSAWYEL